MPKAAEVKFFAFLGSPANSYDKAPYMTGQQLEALISTAEADTEADAIEFLINSGGGNYTQAGLVISALERCTKPTIAVIAGYAASAGYYMALGCDTIKATRNSIIILHGIQSKSEGSVQDMEAAIENMKKFNKALAQLLMTRTGLTEEEVTTKYLSGDVTFTAQEALEAGLIDEVIEEDSDFVAVPVAGAFQYGEFYATLHQQLSQENEDTWITRIADKLSVLFGGKPKAEPKVAVVALSQADEWNISSMISDLRSVNNTCDYVLDSTATPEVQALVKSVQTATSKFIIDLTVLLYTEEAADATTMDARIQEQCAKVAAKKTSDMMATINTDLQDRIQAAVAPVKAQLDTVQAAYDLIKDKPAAETTGAKRKGNPETVTTNPSITAKGQETIKFDSFSFESARIDKPDNN
ncbi:MAG: ATP-dependent Clp protease proteolytic subunit [Bacteroidetes bacterium]|nr:ATP-dependent Clp protease proteolytic subunit [Bacteroidota bacterium]